MPTDNLDAIRAPIIAIFIIQLFALFARSYLQLELVEDGHPTGRAKNLSYLIVPPILLVMLYPILKEHWSFLADRFNLANLRLRTLCVAILVGVLLRLAYWGHLFGFAALGLYRNPDPNTIVGLIFLFSCPTIEALLLHLLITTLLVPVIEEGINRGFFLYSLLRKGRIVAILLSSILFAFAHPPATMPNAFIIGLFLGTFALNSCSLWPPIIAHATFNGLIAVDWLCLQGQWNPTDTTNKLAGIGVVMLLLTASCLFASSKLITQKYAGTNSLPQRTF